MVDERVRYSSELEADPRSVAAQPHSTGAGASGASAGSASSGGAHENGAAGSQTASSSTTSASPSTTITQANVNTDHASSPSTFAQRARSASLQPGTPAPAPPPSHSPTPPNTQIPPSPPRFTTQHPAHSLPHLPKRRHPTRRYRGGKSGESQEEVVPDARGE